jgi:glutamine synthetase adenylyltransferase
MSNLNPNETERLQAIHDLATARLRNCLSDPNVEHDLREIARLSGFQQFRHYPDGMGEESRRLHREYNALVAAQLRGEKNGAAVVKLTDECAAKGIILVPNGEML